MLSPEQINEIHRLHFVEKWSQRRIAGHLKIGRHTLAKYLETPAPPPSHRDRASKLDAFKPALANLQSYAEAVREKSLAVLKGLSPADLEREVPAPGGGTRKVGDYLGILMIDHFHHSGQIAYLRGYLTGKGWFPR